MGVQERKEREKLARQEAILKAAQKIFLTKGLDQTTIDDVAEKAELSKGTIYLYFKSKEELYISVFLKGLDVLMGQFQAMRIQLQGARADELIQEVKEIYYRFFKEYPEYFYINSLLYHGRIKDKINPYIWALTHQKTKKCLMVFADIIQKGIADGLFRQVDSWKTANSFWGAATGVMMLLEDEEHRKYIGIPIKELLDYTTNLLIESLKVRQL
ncbi:transcriptional regulator, TetR family [Candidatus Vecturithrix granuli]|uniref:Transcriptional regulator, TetR family n=1 Tax=Vecturithrix granuli TaxID=1499967 RepID=A0A081BUR1_VECG1|nr:transcriptional regulator, TetR family [Candidatus Vecturithrix granuli]